MPDDSKLTQCVTKAAKLGLLIFYIVLTVACSGDRGPQGAAGETGQGPSVVVPDDIADIQGAIDSISDGNGGTVFVRAGSYTLLQGLHIYSSGITLSGEQGTFIRLADWVNQPVLLIGSDEETPTEVIGNIKIQSLQLDGNRQNQSSEVDLNRTWITNSGIDVRAARQLWVSEVEVHDARGSGLSLSENANYVIIEDSLFHNNYLDGLSFGSSQDAMVSNFFSYENGNAGIRLDGGFAGGRFSNGVVRNNSGQGVFARFSESTGFDNLVISGNDLDGAHLTHQALSNGSGVHQLPFNDCTISENGGYGVSLQSPAPDSTTISILGSTFSDNVSGSITIHSGAVLYQTGNIFY